MPIFLFRILMRSIVKFLQKDTNNELITFQAGAQMEIVFGEHLTTNESTLKAFFDNDVAAVEFYKSTVKHLEKKNRKCHLVVCQLERNGFQENQKVPEWNIVYG